ncbi:mechanosensitive ion channel family protein [Sphingobacterium sp. SYP-B4668]|uniref:mechanosensitive ion channel family protein n=1 Tax=Sphingobacterium sp. SYP-B4668 TaxID=2996035 RepID=UPI0022DD144D|nr:mechanosensitive ion channel domain-containing protein [Sphingobacterium sp. SYP-B4668]
METVNISKFEMWFDKLIDVVIVSIPSIVVGLSILFFGGYLIRFFINMLNRRFEKRKVDVSIRAFVASMLKFVLYALLILTAASTMGIQTTSFIAALSAFGLAVGMALQGSLSNFAGGVLILMFRPFEVGDYISSANGSAGTVERIDLLYTTLVTAEGIKEFSPNGTLANSVIKNYSKILSRRFEYVVGISYDANMKEAKDIILQVLKDDKRVLETPAPEIFVSQLADSSVNLTIRGWAKKEDYWPTANANQEAIKNALDAHGISIPFPQTELHIINDAFGNDKLISKANPKSE